VVAQQIGALVLEADGYLEETRTRISQAKQFLIDGLTGLGLPPLPSAANFFLVKVGNARVFRTALLRRGLLVRDCASFGLPEYMRIGVRTLPECKKLLDVIRIVKDEGGLDSDG
jgi:histidinol-phosphate/aromatic aminotransferase/cobyric acid decarboxylase-like protein